MALTNTKRDVFALAIVALAVRLFSIWKVGGALPSGDSRDYLVLAKNLAFHQVFSLSTSAETLIPSAARPPVYPTFIAALWWGQAAPITAVLVFQAALGAATVALVYLIARDRFSRTTALLAGVGMVFARMSCLYPAFILTEILFTFLVTLGVFLWGRQRPVLTGIAFGIATLTRTTMLPFLFLLFLVPLLPKFRKQWRMYIAIGVIGLSVTSIWVIRNAVVLGRFIPVQEHGLGQIVLLGTMETETLSGRIWTGREWTGDQDALTSTGAGLNGMKKERLRMRLALSRIANDPLHWLAVRARQYPRLFMDDSVIYRNEPPLLIFKRLLFHFCNLIILALAVFGVVIERARFASLSHLLLFPAFLLIVHLPLWIEPRFTLPMMPMVAIMAAVGAIHLFARFRVGNLTVAR